MSSDITDITQTEGELRKALQAAQARNVLYEQAVSMISDIVWRYDANAKGEYIGSYISPVADKMLGLPDGTIGDSFEKYFSFVHPDDLPAMQETLFEVIRTLGKDKTAEYRMLKADGTTLWVRSKCSAYGRFNVYGTTYDITARKREAENLRRMATVVRDSNDAITIQDFEGKITAWNHGAELMYGYREEEAFIKNIDLLTTPDKVEEQKDFIRRLIAGEAITSFETQRVTKDGHVLDIWMTVTKLMDEAGKPVGLASTERDITARKREAENLRRMATVVRDSNDAITIQDFEGKITAWNHGAELMYGYREEEAFIKNIDLLTTPDKVEEQKDFIRRLIAGEAITSFETQRVTKDGHVLDIWMTVTKLMDEAGKPVGLASTERDITEHKRVVEEVHKLNVELEQRVAKRTVQLEAANKELEAFAYSVSHDLRAPLRAVDGFSRILMEEYQPQLSPDAQHYLNLVQTNALQMGQLIDDLLNFSRTSRQALAKRSVDPSEIARQVLEELQSELVGRKVEVSIGDLPECAADPAMLRRVIFNLISNAVKFTKKKEVTQLEIGSINNKGITTYFVKDNGVGFDMRYSSKLFGVFQRLHSGSDYEGTGVGLALVQRIVHKHGGRVWAEAEVDKGATFYFTLGGSE